MTIIIPHSTIAQQINVLYEIRQHLRTEVDNFALVRKRTYGWSSNKI